MAVRTSGKRHSAIQTDLLTETVVLNFSKKNSDLKSQVYQETLDYIASGSGARVHEFKDNRQLVTFLQGAEYSVIVSTNDIPAETALLLKGLGIVQILIGMREDLLDVSDIIIDPLVRRSERFLVGSRYLLPSAARKFSIPKLAGLMDIVPQILEEEVAHNEAENDLLEIVRLYQKLDWDSNFFGRNIGYISCLRLTPNIERHIKKFIRREKIDMLEYLCNCHDRESVTTCERNGYSFVDIRLTFEQFLQSESVERLKGYVVRKAAVSDIPRLKEIATDIYRYSRYYFDTNFDRNKVIEFYTNWVEKAVRGQFDHYAYVLVEGKTVIGFCSIKKIRKNAAAIGLFGLASECKGKGLAQYLLQIALQKLKKEEKINYVEVVTQGRNYEAQRLYQKCGFVTKITELWYHKWFH